MFKCELKYKPWFAALHSHAVPSTHHVVLVACSREQAVYSCSVEAGAARSVAGFNRCDLQRNGGCDV